MPTSQHPISKPCTEPHLDLTVFYFISDNPFYSDVRQHTEEKIYAISVSINPISACNNTSLRYSLRDLALKGQTWQISQLIQLQSNQTYLKASTVFKFRENVTKT